MMLKCKVGEEKQAILDAFKSANICGIKKLVITRETYRAWMVGIEGDPTLSRILSEAWGGSTKFYGVGFEVEQ